MQGVSVGVRPIMSTTMAALMGTLPIAIGWGAGGESRRPLGLAVVGGLAFSQLITLYVTPAVYTYLDAFQHRFSRRLRAPTGEPAPAFGSISRKFLPINPSNGASRFRFLVACRCVLRDAPV